MRRFAVALLLGLFVLAPNAFAALTLQIDAPASARSLLDENLDLSRALRQSSDDALSPDELQRLAAAAPAQARDLLQTEGFFNAQARIDASATGWRLSVTPGERSTIAEVTFYFDGDLGAPEQSSAANSLRNAWSLSVGRPFTQSDWTTAKTDLLARARAAGWPLARWSSTVARVQTIENKVYLSLLMDGGPRFHLGELRIEGLHLQSEDSVRRLAGFAPGALYSEAVLNDFQDRLRKSQLFDTVSVALAPDLHAEDAAAAPVVVRVTEAPRIQTTLGLGYHADTGQSASVEVLDRLPWGLPLWARTKLQYGRDLKSAELEISSHPQTDMSRNIGSLQVEQDSSGAEILTNFSARIGRIREHEHDERLVYAEFLHSLQDDANGRDIADALSLNVQWTLHRLDNMLLPTDGYQALLLLGGGYADANNAASGPFGRTRLLLQGYRPIGGWFGSARIELGDVLSRQAVGVPQTLLWRAGGDDSVRGYGYQELGPEVNGLAVGGRVLATGSLEIAHPLRTDWPNVWGATFVDAGQAAQTWGAWRPDWGVGLGVRWRSPVGPLRIDVARGIEVQRWRLHFSVGMSW